MPNVNVTYEEMDSAAKRLNAGREEIEAKLNELQKLVNSLVNGGYVTDASSRAFQDSYTEFTRGASQTMGGLTGMGEYLTKAAETFRRADQELSSALGKNG